jgi:hypothetical protein
MRSIPRSLIFSFLCGALLQCSPNYEPYQGKTQQAGEESKERSNDLETEDAAQRKKEAAKLDAEDTARRKAEAAKLDAEDAAKQKEEKLAATRIQTVARKYNAEKQLVALRQAAEARQKEEEEAGVCDPSQYYKAQLKTPDREIRYKAFGLLGRSPDSPGTDATPPRTPTRENAQGILERSEESKPRE